MNHLINTNAKVIRDEIYGKPYFIIDDFFVNPDSVYKQYFKKLGDLHRKGEENSLNEIFFIDRRKEVRGYICLLYTSPSPRDEL